MSEKAGTSETKHDKIIWIIVAALVAAGVYGNSYFSGESILTRTIVILALALAAGFLASKTAKGRGFIVLSKDAKTEMRKVVWPSRQETMQTTLIVVVVVLIVGLLLWALDSLVSWLISLIIG
ncbi:MAG TPA: preprotein translocase subunit SecE [Pseudomonadaceae bacterium]|nr:preprotein translocase subunit SecE [Pseudomonadaceae bacterium]